MDGSGPRGDSADTSTRGRGSRRRGNLPGDGQVTGDRWPAVAEVYRHTPPRIRTRGPVERARKTAKQKRCGLKGLFGSEIKKVPGSIPPPGVCGSLREMPRPWSCSFSVYFIYLFQGSCTRCFSCIVQKDVLYQILAKSSFPSAVPMTCIWVPSLTALWRLPSSAYKWRC